ncbi:3-oxoacyl-reductase [Dactylonectria estremocensis]|uniref:3-oxoacyl-reductase n=1 Tax=Dactylonectria estremocensis TaxID=1079267 RepID=A0A9P9IER3_9HYPO|nr:3-oxoacyl-reductase [Dactylonectria estremocensis]
METLAGKTAIVSGSSSGIGAAIARELSLRGAHVVINYPFKSEQKAAESVLLSLQGPAKSIIVEADLSTTTGPSKLVDAATAEFGSIDILVNNAGVVAPFDLGNQDDAQCLRSWETAINTNGRGTFLLTRAVLRHLSPQNSRIINICSTTFTRSWARDLPRKYGCTVNAVAPGPVATELALAAPPQVLETMRATCEATPVASRMAEPWEVAWAVATLCENKAGWLNGVYLPVAGGSTLS